jgi:hypothetical protein
MAAMAAGSGTNSAGRCARIDGSGLKRRSFGDGLSQGFQATDDGPDAQPRQSRHDAISGDCASLSHDAISLAPRKPWFSTGLRRGLDGLPKIDAIADAWRVPWDKPF